MTQSAAITDWPVKARKAVEPFGDRMLVLLDAKTNHEVKGTGISIIVPENARERPDAATVVAIGPDVEVRVDVGDEVLVSRYGGVDVEIEGHGGKFLIVRQSDVLGRVQDLPESFWPDDE